MQNSQSPVLFLRKLRALLSGLQRAEEWRVYCGVALLAGALSGLLLLQAALYGQAQTASVQGQEHIELRVAIPRVEPPAPAAAPQQSARTEPVAEKETARGEWYYSEVHRDWRYRKTP